MAKEIVSSAERNMVWGILTVSLAITAVAIGQLAGGEVLEQIGLLFVNKVHTIPELIGLPILFVGAFFSLCCIDELNETKVLQTIKMKAKELFDNPDTIKNKDL